MIPNPGNDEDAVEKFVVDVPRYAFRKNNKRMPKDAGQPSKSALMARMAKFDLFSKLPKTLLSRLANHAVTHRYGAGELIWRMNETNNQVVFIESGLAKISRHLHRGGSRTYGLYGPGESMGIYAIWAGMKYPTDAVSMNDGMAAILVDTKVLREMMEVNKYLAEHIIVEISRFTEALIRKIEIVSAGTVQTRLAALMTLLIERYGDNTESGHARLPICLTLEQISEIVDARIETVARELAKWKRQGLLAVDADGCSFIEVARLYALLGDR